MLPVTTGKSQTNEMLPVFISSPTLSVGSEEDVHSSSVGLSVINRLNKMNQKPRRNKKDPGKKMDRYRIW